MYKNIFMWLAYLCRDKLNVLNNTLNPESDQDIITPYYINRVITQISDENKEKHQLTL